MIGIDVADLQDPLLHHRGTRAFQIIRHPLEPGPEKYTEIAFWKLWTAKEAVYKALRTTLPFQPNNIQIIFNGDADFTGYCKPISNRPYSGTVSSFSAGCVLAVAHDGEIDIPCFHVVSINTAPGSKEIRQKAIAHFLHEFNENVQFDTTADQLPVIRSTTTNRQYEVSLSHHGRFGAFAYSR